MTSKVVGLLVGGTLLFVLNMPQVGDVASAADQNEGAQNKAAQGKEAEGLPCDKPHIVLSPVH